MMDHANLVAKLRDLHPPQSDGVTEMIAMALLGAISAVGIAIYFHNRRQKTQTSLGKAIERLEGARDHAAADRLALQARVLREVAATIDPAAGFLHGEVWLSRLDAIFHTSFFSQGHGRIFGDELYKSPSIAIVDDLDTELSLLLARLKNVRN